MLLGASESIVLRQSVLGQYWRHCERWHRPRRAGRPQAIREVRCNTAMRQSWCILDITPQEGFIVARGEKYS
jgi:hypothetical protein